MQTHRIVYIIHPWIHSFVLLLNRVSFEVASEYVNWIEVFREGPTEVVEHSCTITT
jgi:hypothetical protein